MTGVSMHIDEVTEGPTPTVGKGGRLSVNSQVDDPFVVASINGDAYIWSTRHTSSDDDHAMYLRNTNSTKKLRIVSVFAGGKSESILTLNSVTGLGSGSDSGEFNIDFSGAESDAVHLANAVGSVGVVTPISYRNISDFGGSTFSDQRGLVLSDGDAITVQISKGGDDTIIDIVGYFE